MVEQRVNSIVLRDREVQLSNYFRLGVIAARDVVNVEQAEPVKGDCCLLREFLRRTKRHEVLGLFDEPTARGTHQHPVRHRRESLHRGTKACNFTSHINCSTTKREHPPRRTIKESAHLKVQRGLGRC